MCNLNSYLSSEAQISSIKPSCLGEIIKWKKLLGTRLNNIPEQGDFILGNTFPRGWQWRTMTPPLSALSSPSVSTLMSHSQCRHLSALWQRMAFSNLLMRIISLICCPYGRPASGLCVSKTHTYTPNNEHFISVHFHTGTHATPVHKLPP